MKTTFALTLLTLLTMTSFTLAPAKTTAPAGAATAEQLALAVVESLQQNSAKDYAALFPTLAEFHGVMDAHTGIYGDLLPEAKQEFAAQYNAKVLPAVSHAFAAVVEEGLRRGIDWKWIAFERVIAVEKNAVVIIEFSSPVGTHRLRIEKVLLLGGHYKVSQFINLV